MLSFTALATAAGPKDPVNDDETASKERLSRLNVMRHRAMALAVQVEAADGMQKAEIIETPLLRYSNPAAQIIMPDATVWAWGRVGRPVVLASVEDTGCEIVSLADQPVSATGKSGLKWSANSSEVKWNAVPDAPPPAETAGLRARQLKEISRQFAATGHYGKGAENQQLRLLDRHLHRYADSKRGLIDGAIYAFASGTNPEVILLVECRQLGERRPAWFYGFTRLSAGALEARRGDKIVWTCPAIVHWSERAPYSSFGFGTEEDVVPQDDLPPAEKL